MPAIKNRVFDLDFFVGNRSQLLAQIKASTGFRVLVTPNAQHIVALEHAGEKFRECYASAEWIVCDSRVIQFICRFMGVAEIDVLTGSDLTRHMFEVVLTGQDRILVIGPTDEDANRLRRKYTRLNVDSYCPPFGFIKEPDELRKIVEVVREIQPNYLFLAVGFPRQEELAAFLSDECDFNCVSLCIGAGIDFITGRQRRAPAWISRMGLEWLFRFSLSPQRLFRRYFIESWHLVPIIARELAKHSKLKHR